MSHKRIVSFEEKKNAIKPGLKHVTPTMSLVDIPVNFDWSSYSHDSIEELMNFIDEVVDHAVDQMGINDVKFWLPQDAFDYILDVGADLFISGYPLSFEYYGEPKILDSEEHLYMAAVSVAFDPETGNAQCFAKIIRLSPDGSVEETREGDRTKWIDSPAISKIIDIEDSIDNDGEAEFVGQLAEFSLTHPYMIANTILNRLEKYRPLTKLYNKLDGLVDYNFILRDEDIDREGEDALKVILVPDESLRAGGAIMYEDGRYRLCQYMHEVDDAEALDKEEELYKMGVAKRIPREPQEYCETVFETSSAAQILRAVRFLWDRYYPFDSTIFTFPLSESAYAESGRPYHELHSFTLGGKRELTQAEEENMNKLRERFGLKK